jgi:RNA polymerase sigma-70 factor (ECF subfamily)
VQDQQPVGATSVSLLARAKNKDQEAWQRIVELYAPLISVWCKRQHGLPEHVCDDITQEVLSQLLKSLPAYRAQSFRGYLRKMTRNKVIDWLRRERLHQAQAAGGTTALRTVSQVAEPYPDDEDEDGDQPTPTEQALLVRKAFEQMASRFDGVTMKVVRLVWLEGLRVKDVALSEGLSEAAVSGRLKRVKQAMAVELEGIVDL